MRRIARGQIDLARDRLDGRGDVGEAVHEARKAFERLRALVRLTRDALSAEADAAHDRIEADSTTIDHVLAGLEEARVRVAAWPLPDDADATMLARGFERVYRRGRRALGAAREETDTERLHELRKRAKDLWHAAQVLRPVAPKRFKKLARSAHSLSDVVGEDHDLAVLFEAARERPNTLSPGECELLTVLVGRRRGALQREALERGRRVYARKPRKVARTVSAAASR